MFLIADKYPAEIPVVMFSCCTLSLDKKETLQSHLNDTIKSLQGKQVIKKVMSAMQKWLKDNTIEWKEKEKIKDNTIEGKEKEEIQGNAEKSLRKKEKTKVKPKDSAEDCVVKKPPMKTAEDCIARIQWDPKLVKESFLVGYLDRFIGVVEQPFTNFCWENFASLDYTVTAIPRHRIQYFKYRGMKVWDKNDRFDIMFNSTGNKGSLIDEIEKYDKEHPADDESGDDADVVYNYDSDTDSDDSSNFTFSKATADTTYDHSDRPNHFVAIHIHDPEILVNMGSIQDHIRSKDPRLVQCFIPLSALHVTLAMLRLNGEDQISDCVRALHDARFKLGHFFTPNPMYLEFDCLGNFNQRVLFAKPKRDENFLKFIQELQDHLLNKGINVYHSFDYVPHLTVLKMSRPMTKILNSYYIDQLTYIEKEQAHVGKQVCDRMYLCEISEMRDVDGFYRNLTSVSLVPDTSKHNDLDHDFSGEL